MRAPSCFQMPGMSWPREIRPTPIAPTLMRLLGAAAPSTDAGTIDGKPTGDRACGDEALAGVGDEPPAAVTWLSLVIDC